jgi:hypothetical protein
MLVSALPVLPEGGIPEAGAMERWMGMDGVADWLMGTADKVLNKISLPGFGTPVYAPGTVITQTPTGSTFVRQAEGYPVTAPVSQSKAGLDISAGAGVMLAGAAVLIALVMMSRGGDKK